MAVEPEIKAIQHFLDGGSDALHQQARQSWTALRDGAWNASPTVAAPSWVRPLARREHAHCVKMATERTAAAPVPQQIGILPIWTGNNEDSEPGPHWFATHAVVLDGEPLGPWETSPVYDDATIRFERRLAVEVQRWRVAYVVHVATYAPSVELAFRGERFGVIDSELYSVTSAVYLPGNPLPRPTRDVPMWSKLLEPRVDGVEPTLIERLHAHSIISDGDDIAD
ncbi:MAG: hypothetical protein AAGH67_01440 [Cyanobacteria bacterium P01_H01_bin.162]